MVSRRVAASPLPGASATPSDDVAAWRDLVSYPLDEQSVRLHQAYMVALRAREFGVRLALGADPDHILRLVVERGLVLTAIGVMAWLVLYAPTAPQLRAYLYEVTVADPATLAAATLALLATACFASWIPARRAARVAPAQALRAE